MTGTSTTTYLEKLCGWFFQRRRGGLRGERLLGISAGVFERAAGTTCGFVCGGREGGEAGKSLATEGGLDFMDGKAWEPWESQDGLAGWGGRAKTPF